MTGNRQLAKNRVLQLDGLRALAVMVVVAFHFLNNQYAAMDITKLSTIEKVLMKGTYFGWCGVDLFFVLSGFLIGTILLTNRESQRFFKTFYARRFLRIIPIYYVLLLVFLLCKYLPWYNTEAIIFHKEIPIGYYFFFLQNFVMGARGHFGSEAITPTWSLAIEEQFYLIIPCVIYFLKPKYLKYFIIFCLVMAPISRLLSVNWYQKYTLLTSRIDSPVMGLLVAYLMQQKGFVMFIKNNLTRVKIFSVSFLVAAGLLYVFFNTGIFNHTIIALNFAVILIISLFTTEGPYYKILTSKPLLRIGMLSYFIYLFHQLVNGMLHLVFLQQKTPMLDGLTAKFITVTALIITWLLAELSYKYFEKPLIGFSHSFKY